MATRKKTTTNSDVAAELMQEAASMNDQDAVIEKALADSERLREQDATHPPTRPWESGRAYQRKLLSTNVESRPGWVTRWTRFDMIDARLAQGYRLARPADYGGLSHSEPGEESMVEKGVIRRRELVLMEIPVEGSEAYRAQIRRERERQTTAPGQIIDDAAKESGIQTYDPRDGHPR